MKLSYYPGCTIKNRAGNFEDTLLFSMKHLGVEIKELDRWNCCGTVLSLSEDDSMRQLAPVRNMLRVKEANASRVMTACSMCYNTLKRTNDRVKADPVLLKRMNAFMTDETTVYEGDVDVVHTLEILREFKANAKAISAKVVKPLARHYVCCRVGKAARASRRASLDRHARGRLGRLLRLRPRQRDELTSARWGSRTNRSTQPSRTK
jgi:heterodisulfide reductase subunit B2